MSATVIQIRSDRKAILARERVRERILLSQRRLPSKLFYCFVSPKLRIRNDKLRTFGRIGIIRSIECPAIQSITFCWNGRTSKIDRLEAGAYIESKIAGWCTQPRFDKPTDLKFIGLSCWIRWIRYT